MGGQYWCVIVTISESLKSRSDFNTYTLKVTQYREGRLGNKVDCGEVAGVFGTPLGFALEWTPDRWYVSGRNLVQEEGHLSRIRHHDIKRVVNKQ